MTSSQPSPSSDDAARKTNRLPRDRVSSHHGRESADDWSSYLRAFRNHQIGIIAEIGNRLEANGRVCQLLGVTPEELARHSYQDLTHAADVPQSTHLRDQLIRGDIDSVRIKKRYLRGDRSTCDAIARVTRLRAPDGETVGSITTIQAEEKDHSRTLDSIGRVLEPIPQSTRIGVALLNGATDVILAVDDPLLEILGVDRSDFCRDGLALLQIDALDPAGSSFRELTIPRTGCDQRLDLLLSRTTTNPDLTTLFIFELTQRQRVIEDLLDRELMLVASQRLAHVGSYRWEIACDQVVWSDELHRIYGLAPGEFPGTLSAFIAFLHPDDRDRIQHTLESVLARGIHFKIEERIIRPDGSVRTLLSSGEVIRDPDGQPIRIVGACRDITADREREQARERIEQQLLQMQKVESIGLLARGIAHDFNGIMQAILLNAEAAEQDLPSDSPVRTFLANIVQSTETARKICGSILSYSGNGGRSIGPTSLNGIVEEVAVLLRSAMSKKIKLAVDLEPTIPIAELDANQMRQVVLNLVTNAIEAIGEQSGQINIRTSVTNPQDPRSHASVIPNLSSDGEYLRLDVDDSGNGISDEAQARIFDPFYSSKQSGRGLGLSTVLGIVRSHGGSLCVESKPGFGSTFSIFIPLIRTSTSHDADAMTESDPPPATRTVRSRRILIADDEALIRSVLRRLLENKGYEVDEVADGEAAIHAIRENGDHYLAIVLDLTMPKQDGSTVYRFIRAHQPTLPVILCSGYGADSSLDEVSSPHTTFLCKPFTIDELTAVLPTNPET